MIFIKNEIVKKSSRHSHKLTLDFINILQTLILDLRFLLYIDIPNCKILYGNLYI